MSYPLMRTRTCAYQGVRNVRLSGNLACFVFLKHPFRDSPFWLITDDIRYSLILHNQCEYQCLRTPQMNWSCTSPTKMVVFTQYCWKQRISYICIKCAQGQFNIICCSSGPVDHDYSKINKKMPIANKCSANPAIIYLSYNLYL